MHIWKTFLLCQEMSYLHVSSRLASGKKVIAEDSRVTPQSYEGTNCDLLFQLIISHAVLIQSTLGLICIFFLVSKARHDTQREICNHVLEGKILIKRLKLQQESEEKPQKVVIVASFEGDEKAYSVLASNTSSFNRCPGLMCFIDLNNL